LTTQHCILSADLKKRTPSDCFFGDAIGMENTFKSFWSVLLILCHKKRKIICLLSDH